VSELSTLSLPLHNTSCTKVLPVPLPGSSRTFALLCDDHRVHVVDIDRVNSVVCCLASKTKKYVDFWMDSCGNLLCGLTNEGDVELFRTKTLINFEFS
jgi:hypothetical protein